MSTLKDAVHDLLDERFPVEEAMDRHFSSSFRHRINGQWHDRAAFLARIVLLRQLVERVAITVLDEFQAGGRYAERHVIELLHRDGSRNLVEVYLFAQLGNDGRFDRIEEATFELAQVSV